MTPAILVVNAGSSSVKFRVYETGAAQPLRQLVSGQIDGIGVRPRLRATGAQDEDLIDRRFDAKEVPDVATARACGKCAYDAPGSWPGPG